MRTDIRQGDSLSPTLFDIIMDEIIKKVKEIDAGYGMGNRHIKICYADATLIAVDEDGLQRLLYRFTTVAESFNIVSTEKT